jgi:hypothetical protein
LTYALSAPLLPTSPPRPAFNRFAAAARRRHLLFAPPPAAAFDCCAAAATVAACRSTAVYERLVTRAVIPMVVSTLFTFVVMVIVFVEVFADEPMPTTSLSILVSAHAVLRRSAPLLAAVSWS